MPAPTRRLVVRPGSTYADVAAATEIGGWVQPSNRIAGSSSGLGYDSPPVEQDPISTGGITYVQDPPTPEDTYPGDLNVVVGAAAGGFSAPVGAAEIQATHQTWAMVSGTFGNDDDPFYYQHIVTATRAGSVVAKCVDLQESLWADEMREQDWPAGAIGYEVEQYEVTPGEWMPASEVLEAHVAAVITPVVALGAHYAGLVARIHANADWFRADRAEDATITPRRVSGTGQWFFGTSVPPPAGTTLARPYGRKDVTLPQTGAAEPVPWTFSFPMDREVQRHTGVFAFHYTVCLQEDSGAEVRVGDAEGTATVNGEFEARAGVNFDDVTYTIRPPRFRWIYDTPPIRQTTHRDDHLAGGAYQTWPAPISRQLSNTTFGGYL